MLDAGFPEVIWVSDRKAGELLSQSGSRSQPELMEIEPLSSVRDYNRYVLNELPNWIQKSHALIFQWDGFVLHPDQWRNEFLEFDYLGAPWPEIYGNAVRRVGNGGFSLRSRRLMKAMQSMGPWNGEEPEDRLIGVICADALEYEHGCRIAPVDLARYFSVEHLTLPNFSNDPNGPISPTFGFHGVFNFHLAFEDDELIELIDHTLDHFESINILRSWGASALLVNLNQAGRFSMVHELMRRMPHLEKNV